MREGLAYLDTEEKCRDLARQVTEPRRKKQLEYVAVTAQGGSARAPSHLSLLKTLS